MGTMPRNQSPIVIDLNILPPEYRPRELPSIFRLLWGLAIVLFVLAIPLVFLGIAERARVRQLSGELEQAQSTLQALRTPAADALGLQQQFSDTLKILEQAKGTVVIHHFSGNDDELECALERGYWISLGTVICNSKMRQDQIPKIPLENMLLETDSPWNDPFSKGLNNKPWNVAFSADIIAKKKDLPVFQVVNQTTENAKKAFGLDI